MAYAALISLSQATDLILNHDKYSISVGERKLITSISRLVNSLISFFGIFPEKANSLEAKIRDMANEAEDVIQYFMWHRCQMNWFSFWLFRVRGADNFEQKLKRVRNEIVLTARGVMNDLPAASSSRVAATGKSDVVIGLHDDLIAIKRRLCGESSKLGIIPIVGMGGIGKTTLARKAYDDPLIIEYFDIHVFIQVSQDYSANEFLFNLLASIQLSKEQLLGEKNEFGIAENVYNESEIAENVYKSLKGRRYLIVMDDIWSTKTWDDVRNIFPDDKNGSRILLTTRLSDVAAYASSDSPLHQMKFMDGSCSWNLLKQKVFTNSQDCPPELEDMGKAIAGGCRGLPLAVVLVAGILSSVDKTRASWEETTKNVNSVVDGQLDEILSLSYMHLPHHLRPCFLFMGAFPKDQKIRVSRIIKLWVAEGFVRGRNGCKSLEEEAEEYLEDLVKRSLVLVTSRKSNGKIKRCSLHDLVRELCVRKAEEEKFLLTNKHVLPDGRKDERRISICHPGLNSIRYHLVCHPTTHTILCFNTIDQSSLAFLVGFSLLRVLDVMRCRNGKVPPQVFELYHLNYLALGFSFEIPAAISNLLHLQTLIIGSRSTGFSGHAPFSSYLPQEIWRMPQLRHLMLYDSFKLPDPVPAVGPTPLPLENLQTLSSVRSFSCSRRVLKMFPNLKKLALVYFRSKVHHRLHNLEKVHHRLHNLEDLHQLEKLKITSKGNFSWEGRINPILPSSLKKLSLVGGRLRWKDMSIVGLLPNLQVLKLKDDACDGDTWETTEGEFPQLQYLLISGSNLEHWTTASDHFPRLKCLVLQHCRNLTEIPDGIGEIPTLERIMVDALNQSLMDSVKEIVRVQKEFGNDAFQAYAINRKRRSRE